MLNPSIWLVDQSFKTLKVFSHLYLTRQIFIKRSFWPNSRGNAMIFRRKWYQICTKSKAKESGWTVMKKGSFSLFYLQAIERVLFISFLCCSLRELEIVHHMLVITPLFRIISDQIMEVKAMNLFGRHRRGQIWRCLCISGKCHR